MTYRTRHRRAELLDLAFYVGATIFLVVIAAALIVLARHDPMLQSMLAAGMLPFIPQGRAEALHKAAGDLLDDLTRFLRSETHARLTAAVSDAMTHLRVPDGSSVPSPAGHVLASTVHAQEGALRAAMGFLAHHYEDEDPNYDAIRCADGLSEILDALGDWQVERAMCCPFHAGGGDRALSCGGDAPQPLPDLDEPLPHELDGPPFPVGTRVRFTMALDRISFLVPEGTTGTVVPCVGDPGCHRHYEGAEDNQAVVHVLLDGAVEGLEEWRNVVHFLGEHVDDEDAADYLVRIEDRPKCHGSEDAHGKPACSGHLDHPLGDDGEVEYGWLSPTPRGEDALALYRALPGGDPAESFYALWCPTCAKMAEDENEVEKVAAITLYKPA